MAQLATTQANNREQLVTQQQKLTDLLANLNQIIGEKGEQTLLEAISQQRWYGFKNKREIVFDSYTGYLFPNFEYMPHISFSSWEKEKKNTHLMILLKAYGQVLILFFSVTMNINFMITMNLVLVFLLSFQEKIMYICFCMIKVEIIIMFVLVILIKMGI